MSTYIADISRGGNYNEEVGLDIDGDIIGTTPDEIYMIMIYYLDQK